jgi:hypothetical protein
MGLSSTSKLFPTWVLGNFEKKNQGFYAKLAFHDDQGEKDHVFGTIIVQELSMDPKM